MPTHTWRLLAAATLSAPLLVACDTRDESALNDSAAGTMAMTDSMGRAGTMNGTAAGGMDASLASFVAMVNEAEIEAGRLATTKARNADVKSYAQDMVDAHQKAMTELRELSGRSGWTLPVGMDSAAGGTMSGSSMAGTTGTDVSQPTTGSSTGTGTMAQGDAMSMSTTITEVRQAHEQAMTKLRSATGATFDRAYMDSQVAAHQQTLDVLRQHMGMVQNNELRTEMDGLQREVEEHLRRATEIAQKIG